MGEKLSAEDLAGAEVVTPPAGLGKLSADDLAGAEVAPSPAQTEDPDLAFLKPGFHRPAPGAAPAGPPDRIGQAAADYRANVGALTGQTATQMADSLAAANNAGPEHASKAAALGRGALQGATLGFADEIGAAAESLLGPRSYKSYRDEIRANDAQAKAEHPYAYGGGEIGGGIATAFVPGLSLAKGASIAKVAAQGALMGGLAGAGESTADNAIGVLRDAGESAAVGGAGGALLHYGAGKAAKLLARWLPGLADKQAAEALTRKVGKAGAPESLTRPVMNDPNLPEVLNTPIDAGGKKPVTLARVAGKSAAEVKPVIEAGQQRIDDALAGHFHTADAASGGGGKLGDLARHIDQEIAERGKDPLNAEHIKALAKTRDDALRSWGPTEEAIEQRQNELEHRRGKIYDRADQVRLGDLVDHYNAEIATAQKTPGNEPVVAALEKARDSAVNAWGKGKVFNPDAVIEEAGPWKGKTAGGAVEELEKMAKARPALADQLNTEAQRIREAASTEGINHEARIPAREVRRYATHLQNEGASDVADPKIAARAKQFLGTTTKDFVNGHVEKTLGKADRKALEDLNRRTTDLIAWPDVAAGKNADAAVRDRVLNEFDTRVPTHKLDELASQLEERGAQRIDKLNKGSVSANAKENLGTNTRDFVRRHLAEHLSPADVAAAEKAMAHRQSLKSIAKVIEDRIPREAANKGGGLLKTGGHLLGLEQIGEAAHKALAGDYIGAATHLGTAAGAAALPHVISGAGAAKRALVRGAAGATDYLARVVASAEGGNTWAKQQLAMLMQSSPSGAARVAAAIARHRGLGGSGTIEP